ncbi:acetyl-CoA C-acetyltransferase [Paenibacillus ginsengarvi]|uniref:acetyl-CoA C-acetyltransferase n=1 Tax=Paenibacillus ginsengarvi TaxID=400777 RepID=A0A3B0C782_9BACL|nr:acetyl-CoA C-acetyltransferase [Paenibacillus ginsengarvi]RKN79217.1 acetyl-CoA C-acetyltransferase [Paenibacillus ginsengarvi]
MTEQVYILEGARTPFGAFGQSLRQVSATELGLHSAKEALRRAAVEPGSVEQVVYGNVIHSGTDASYTSRHIALKAGIPVETPALTVNRLCGSGMQAVISAAQMIRLGEAGVCLAGGTENMSLSPHADFTSRFGGMKLGNLQLEDMLLHTLTDAYIGCGMGMTAERLASRYGISREEQDELAALSHLRAAKAADDGVLAEEIVQVEVPGRGGPAQVGLDEQIRRDTSAALLAKLKPAFQRDGGTVTAGNASSINDGAASLVLAGNSRLQGRKPLARIVSWGIAGVEPDVMGIGPVPAARMALARAGLAVSDMDAVEINEAFAVQYLAVERELGLDREKTNVNGGAIALGHPVGASGARILLTLAYELRRRNLRYGLAALCVGGGQGVAVVLEHNPE